MKLWKYGIILVSVSMLMLPSAVVSAETITDGQNDVLLTTDGGISYQTGLTRTEIDVQTVTCTFDESTVTLVLEIWDVGTVQDGEGYEYRAFVNTTDSKYTMNYNGGDYLCTAYRFDDGNIIDPEPEFSVSENTITTVFELLGDTTIVELVANAAYVVGEAEYMDWLPDSEGPSADEEPVDHPDETQTVPDGQDDVLKSLEGTCNFTGNQSKPDIDVKQITCTIEGTTLTLELEIWDAGTIQQADLYMYFATVNTTDFKYDISLIDGRDGADVTDRTNVEYMSETPDLEIGVHSIKAVFQLQGNSTIEEVWGWATYRSDPLYQDWAPDNRGPEGSFGEDIPDDDDDDTTGDDDDDEDSDDKPDTPGFETIAVIAAIGLAFILIKRRRK